MARARFLCGIGGCRKPAEYFGYFAGGCCLEHAAELCRNFPEQGVEQFRPEFREEIQREMERKRD